MSKSEPVETPFDPVPALAAELNLPRASVSAVVKLLAESSTVPFIARYRKEATGGLDEVQIRAIEERRSYLVEMEARRKAITSEISSQGKLSPELAKKLACATTKAELEDLYLPFKPKRRTRATIAKERGLEPLADLIWAQARDGSPSASAQGFVNAEKEVADVAAALAGARDICAERIAEDPEVRKHTREAYVRDGSIRVGKTKDFDPFLLLDDFRNDKPEDYKAGFPWHPHRGIETITYVLAGSVEHGDSLGNKGKMTAGDVQWMTAGSGILHQEMPKGDPQGRMHGFQLWANLPAALKMTDPRYQDIPSSAIPEVTDDDGTRARIICGEFWGQKGPVEGVAADPNYVDVSVPPGQRKRLKIETTRNAFAYVFAGSGTFRDASDPRAVLTEQVEKPDAPPKYDVGNHSLVLFDRGDEIGVQAGDEGIRFLLVSGKPIEEPVAWYGPIVMNTQEQLREAMSELQTGAFIKHR